MSRYNHHADFQTTERDGDSFALDVSIDMDGIDVRLSIDPFFHGMPRDSVEALLTPDEAFRLAQALTEAAYEAANLQHRAPRGEPQ